LNFPEFVQIPFVRQPILLRRSNAARRGQNDRLEAYPTLLSRAIDRQFAQILTPQEFVPFSTDHWPLRYQETSAQVISRTSEKVRAT
jgi:hypothetical protein